MLKKSLFAILSVTLVLLLATTSVSGVQAQEPNEEGNFIFVNYIGQELFLDLDDTLYTVPGTNTSPEGGQLTLQLAPGEHKFAANVPGVIGKAGEFTLSPGQTIAKAAIIDQTPPAIDRDGILLAKPKDIVNVFDFDPLAGAVEEAAIVDTWQPAVAAPGQASIVWTNYIGDELTVDLNGQVYKVSPPANDIPGRLQIDIPPGDYTYTASVPNGSINGKLTVVAGQVVGLSLTATQLEEREYEVGEEYDFLLPVALQVNQEELTAQAAAAVDPVTTDDSPATLPLSGGDTSTPILADEPVRSDGLLVKNYAGDTLTFTINAQTYTIAPNDELIIDLPPGSYTFTASRPFVAATGTVDVQAGQGLELSIAINVAGDTLSLYQN